MRIRLAVIFSLVCGAALADKPITTLGDALAAHPGAGHTCLEDYPAAAVKAHAEGTTRVDFTITAKGSVRDVKVSRSSGNKDLDDAAVTCASHWLYPPFKKNGVAVDGLWTADVVWKIPPPPAMQMAILCLHFRKDQSPPPPGLGHTIINFRVASDGATKDIEVVQSSGFDAWDRVATDCVKERHFDTSMFTLPADGMAGHWDMDWIGAIAAAQSWR